jgi:GTP-dependent phosphoenolpyruvate carboxykinase
MATALEHVTSLESMNQDVSAWVDQVAKLTQPDHVYWCDGSQLEFQALQRQLIASNDLCVHQK